MDWTTYFKENRIEIVYEPDITELIGYLKQMKDYELFMHYPTVQAVENPSIRTLLEDFFITTSSMREQERFLDANFEKLSERHLPECSEIKSLFYKKNVVIVGAGPSVNQELPSLKQYRNNITIFATGHIAGTLLREGIIPDAIIITDPQPHMYQQVKGLDTKTCLYRISKWVSKGRRNSRKNRGKSFRNRRFCDYNGAGYCIAVQGRKSNICRS